MVQLYVGNSNMVHKKFVRGASAMYIIEEALRLPSKVKKLRPHETTVAKHRSSDKTPASAAPCHRCVGCDMVVYSFYIFDRHGPCAQLQREDLD